VGESLAGGFFDFRFGCVGAAEEDVVVDGVVEKEGVLRDDADVFAQRIMRDATEVVSVEAESATLRVVEAEDERKHGALAGTAGADEGDALAGGDAQTDVFERRDLGPVGERNAVELDFTATGGDGGGFGGVHDGARFAHEVEDVRRCSKAALEHEVDTA